jgi:hypothetical protein
MSTWIPVEKSPTTASVCALDSPRANSLVTCHLDLFIYRGL